MTDKNKSDHLFFQPTFGNRPERIIGRESEVFSVLNGLKEPAGSRDRCILFLGQRGMGKTALLLEIADQAASMGFITARVTAYEGMSSAIIEQLQLNGSQFFKNEKRKLTGINTGALGFSFGLTFSEEAQKQYGFRSKMSLLCDKLEEKGKGVLILIDEVHTSEAMREVAASYQELVGDRKNIAIVMAGLPQAVSDVLNDKVLTFLNRATRMELNEISVSSISAYYEYAFSSMGLNYTNNLILSAAEKTRGLPYLMQLIGYYLTQYSKASGIINEETLLKAEKASLEDMDNNVYYPILSPLSNNDRFFLKTMASLGEDVTTEKLKEKLGSKASSLQTYRKRALDAGIIESPRRGELVFAVPYFREYLMKTK